MKPMDTLQAALARHSLRALLGLSAFHVAVITTSNHLVQIPFTIAGLCTTWGAFIFRAVAPERP